MHSHAHCRVSAQVAKHIEKQQKEKESRAMERLHLLLPALGPTLRAVALQHCDWDEERTLTMLRRFQVRRWGRDEQDKGTGEPTESGGGWLGLSVSLC